eukprot:2859241-Pleurochrysis_carterae.AAC.3
MKKGNKKAWAGGIGSLRPRSYCFLAKIRGKCGNALLPARSFLGVPHDERHREGQLHELRPENVVRVIGVDVKGGLGAVKSVQLEVANVNEQAGNEQASGEQRCG